MILRADCQDRYAPHNRRERSAPICTITMMQSARQNALRKCAGTQEKVQGARRKAGAENTRVRNDNHHHVDAVSVTAYVAASMSCQSPAADKDATSDYGNVMPPKTLSPGDWRHATTRFHIEPARGLSAPIRAGAAVLLALASTNIHTPLSPLRCAHIR